MNNGSFDDLINKILNFFSGSSVPEIVIGTKDKTYMKISALLVAVLLVLFGFPSRLTGIVLLVAIISKTQITLTVGTPETKAKYKVDKEAFYKTQDTKDENEYSEYTVE